MPAIQLSLIFRCKTRFSTFDILSRHAQLTLGQSHGSQELNAVLPLHLLPLAIPLEFFSHQVNDFWQSLERSLRIQECQPCSSRNDIYCSLREFVPHGIPHLAIHERV